MVERARLESECSRKVTVGSNPTLTAHICSLFRCYSLAHLNVRVKSSESHPHRPSLKATGGKPAENIFRARLVLGI